MEYKNAQLNSKVVFLHALRIDICGEDTCRGKVVPYIRQHAYMYPYGYKCSTLSLHTKEKEENPQAKEKLHLEDGD